MALVSNPVSEKILGNNGNVHVYSLEAGAGPWGQIVFINISTQSIKSFAASFPINDFLTVFSHPNV